MHDVLIFLSGALFSLIIVALALILAFKVTDYKDEQEMRKEQKRKTLIPKVKGGNVIKPKTPDQLRLEKDEEFQAFTDIINTP